MSGTTYEQQVSRHARQDAYRRRLIQARDDRERMKAALEKIIFKLDGTEKPAALIILAIAKEGLNGKAE